MQDHSYSKNSHFQRAAAGVVNEKLNELITKKFDVDKLSLESNRVVRIADMGCAAGPNTFLAMENLVRTIRANCLREAPEFHVFFNDLPSNDFNALFAALPSDNNRGYFAAGVAGSFHRRLFPDLYLHFVYTSTALHRLSMAPEEVSRTGSPAWNKGRVHYTSAGKEVVKAYSNQFGKDFGDFLQAREKEVVSGGMVTIIMPGIPNGMPHRKVPSGLMFHLMDECLADMVKEGLIPEKDVDNFNLPVYTPSPEEMTTAVTQNGEFTIEAMELTNPSPTPAGPIDVRMWTMHVRVAMDAILREDFTADTIDELFERLCMKLSAATEELDSTYKDGIQLFIVLRRK
ncbi:hypothetical protein MLD38_003875 [Melastoma candidum]|uniref:Uncharacterized protein n=1 Tax=Melastoma candidum TaxID=119954 RepID=A0ACB9S3T3_9MYRT|nr:hypothetical protein MLD38_003875 [Melastoma candidum]